MQLKHALLLAGSLSLIGTVGLYAAKTITIPTTPADHNAYLSTLVLGDKDTQTLTLELTGQDRLIIPERLIAGDAENNYIDPNAQFAIIAGGGSWIEDEKNEIWASGDNSAIWAGLENKIYAENAVIGAWRKNTIEKNAERSVIAWGASNTIFSQNVVIGGGGDNEIHAENSTIAGGESLTISASAPNSFAAGQAVNINQTWTFAWSDFDYMQYEMLENKKELSPAKPNTFIVRSLNGMAINTGVSITWVNVIVDGAVQIDGSSGEVLADADCNSGTAGTFDMKEGCFYYCDGRYRQSFNAAFNAAVGQEEKTNCSHISRCEFDGIRLRPGDQVIAYNVPRAANCEAETVRAQIECGKEGKFIKIKDGKEIGDKEFTFSYCMPRDQTSTGIIDQFNPSKK